MGNSFGCSASGERLVSAARDGDYVEAKMLLDCNPCLAKYSTFGGLNSPLHFAAAKGHNEIVALLLENGADVNSRNYCGQTALMQACRYGHWEVVQSLLLFRCNVTRADYLSGRTALHFASVNGHIRCMRLVVADFVPSAPFESLNAHTVSNGSDASNNKTNALSKFVNKAADGGITALHMAALNGYFDCVQLLLDLHANVSAVTFHYGTSMDLIGAGSTPLHYAACGGNLKCCQPKLKRELREMLMYVLKLFDSSQSFSNISWKLVSFEIWAQKNTVDPSCKRCQSFVPKLQRVLLIFHMSEDEFIDCFDAINDGYVQCFRWLPIDVARMWGRNWLEPLLAPNSDLPIPVFPPSNYLSLPLMSVLNIARDCGLQFSATASDEADICAVCLERACSVAAEGCSHELCVRCALYLCSTSNIPSESSIPPGSIPCPLCRHGILSFIKLPGSSTKDIKLPLSISLCTPCMLHPRERQHDTSETVVSPEMRKNRSASISSDIFCPVTCSPFPSVGIPLCTCNEGPCPNFDSRESEDQEESPSHTVSSEREKLEGVRLEKTTCSNMFWGRRSCSREHQCNAEINA